MTATLRLVLPKTIAILIFIAAAATLINPVYAQTATSAATRREAVKERVDTRREAVATKIAAMKERIATREAALKARLDTFKDKRKAQVAERVNTNLNSINQKQTSQMQTHLDRMSELLTKLEERVNKPTPDIKDVTAAKAAIASSMASISLASDAVAAQAEKDYTINLTTESQVRVDAQAMRDQLRTDLTSTRSLVVEAKQSVANAVRVAKGRPKLQEGTPSGQQ